MMKRLSLTELEKYIESIDTAEYAKTRNYIDGSTKLSEYISRGFISLPRVQELILKNNTKSSAFKLLSELSWREYWQHTWRVRGDEIFEYFRPLPFEPRSGLPTAVLEASTGIKALDEGIHQLYETGFIDNHMRMWLAGLVCNVAKCDWKIGAAWMHSYLIDGDFASNHLSWQWVAGSYTGKPYLPQQANINTYTETEQDDTYLNNTYAHIADMDVPDELNDLTKTLPAHKATMLHDTITIDEIHAAETVLLCSPWTLDPTWRSADTGQRVLVIPSDIYQEGAYSQHVLDSIQHFVQQIDELRICNLSDKQIKQLSPNTILRKDYPGIATWPGQVDGAELLQPNLPEKFYPSYSAYWKAIEKSQ
ncbi:hypothetical protein H7097_03415 [Aeromicrobium sp.]|nr:hypothetical protein [Candidatus Saccharibacteria bacterium]